MILAHEHPPVQVFIIYLFIIIRNNLIKFCSLLFMQ